MRTVEVAIGEEKVPANVYDSLWEYVSGWDISHYAIEPAIDVGEHMWREWTPLDDPECHVMRLGEDILVDGEPYIWLNTGETRISLILKERIYDTFWAEFERVTDESGFVTYYATGRIYPERPVV